MHNNKFAFILFIGCFFLQDLVMAQENPETVIDPSTQTPPEAGSDANTTTTEDAALTYDGYGKTHGYLGPVTLGPMITLLAFPVPIGLGVEGRLLDILSFGVEYSLFPTLTLGGVGVHFNSYDAKLRIHPFLGAFMLGVAVGKQSLGAKARFDYSVAPGISSGAQIKAEVNTTFVTPHLGWRWISKTGFMFGMEFGWQKALHADTDVGVKFDNPALQDAIEADKDYQEKRQDVEDIAEKLGELGLPIVALLQFGFLF